MEGLQTGWILFALMYDREYRGRRGGGTCRHELVHCGPEGDWAMDHLLSMMMMMMTMMEVIEAAMRASPLKNDNDIDGVASVAGQKTLPG